MTYDSAVLADIPITYLKVDEPSGTTATDASGNANDGTYVDVPVFSITPYGSLPGSAVQLGTASTFDARITIPVAGFAPGSGDWSFEAFVKIEGDLSAAANSGLYYGDDGAGNFIQIRAASDNDTGAGPKLRVAYQAGVVVDGDFSNDHAWHHVLVTYDSATTTTTVYVDGVAVGASASTAYAFGALTTASTVGDQGGPGDAYNGSIDQIAFYHTALSADRVLAHFAASLAAITEGPTVRLVTSRALAVPHQVQRWVLPIICKRFANIGPDDQIEAQQDVAAVREFFLGLRRSGTPVAFQEGTSRHLVVVRDVSFPDGMVEQWGNQRDGMEGLLMVTVDSTEDV